MSLSNSIKSKAFIVNLTKFTTASFVVISIIDITPAAAFSVTFNNRGFEDTVDFNQDPDVGWEGIGDTFIDNSDNNNNNFTQTDPVEGNFQAVITTGRSSVVDDFNTSAGTFNFSGINPVTATSANGADALQDFLGLPTSSLSISRSNSADDNFFRTAKEGSAIYQDISVSFTQEDIDDGYNIFELDFNWAYLSNDGVVDPRLGEQDFSFFTVYDTSSDIADRSITAVDGNPFLDSSGSTNVNLNNTGSDFQNVNTTYYDTNNIYTYTSEPITTAGEYNYRVGLGVVDVDGSDRTSALLVDNFNVRQVPFDFSPAAGIGIVFGLIGFHRLKRRFDCQS